MSGDVGRMLTSQTARVPQMNFTETPWVLEAYFGPLDCLHGLRYRQDFMITRPVGLGIVVNMRPYWETFGSFCGRYGHLPPR